MSKKTLLIIFKISFLVILGLGVYSFVHSQQALLGNGNITQRDQWTSTSTPDVAITQSTYGKAVKISGLADGCLSLVTGLFTSSGSACGAGSLGGTGFAGMMASWLDSDTLMATSTIVGSHFIATSSTSSRFPYASTTVISVSGDSYFTGVIRNVGGAILGYAQGSSGALTTYPSSVTQTDAFKVFGNNGVSAYVERFKVTSAGNVGIGTTSPYATLSVVGPVVAEYFNATSTTATSTFAGDITQGLGKILTTHSVRSDASDGVLLQANNYTNVGLFGAGNTSNSLFYGGVNIDGATRLATSLSGCVRALLGVISASGTCSPYPFTPTTNYAVTNQATTGIPWFQNGLNASTTSRFVHTKTGSLVIGADVNTGDFVQYSDTFDRNVVNAINWTVTGTNFVQYGVMGGRGNGASWSANGFTGTQPYRRNNTLTFMADVTPGTSADFMIGLSSSPSSLNYTNMPHAIRFISSNTTNVYENGTDRGSVSASWVASTTYRVKIVVNPTGAIYYRSSNGGDTWTKLYNGTANNITTTPLYPSLTAVGTGFLHVDNVSISNGFDVLTASQFVPKNFTVGEGDLLVNGGKVTVATTSATSTFAGGVAFSRSVTMATTDGNVGINTATPSSKLDVVGTIQGSNFNGNVNASSTFTGLISGAVGANLTLNVNTANNLILNPSGAKVGIGGTPAFNLDVFSPVTGIVVDNVMRVTSAARFVGNTVNATYPGGLGQANFIFQKLGVQTWSIGSDFAADGTKDFFFYDNTNLNNPLYVSNTGDLRLGSAGTAATGGYNGTQRATLKADTGNFGIGEIAPASKLSVSGGATIGASYDTTASPTNGLLVEGKVGIGTTVTDAQLTVLRSDSVYNSGATAGLFVGANTTQRLQVGYDTNLNASYLQSNNSGVSNTSILLNPNGGSIGIGTSSPASILDITASTPLPRLTNTSASGYSGLVFYENATRKGSVYNIGSSFATTDRQNDTELISDSGDISFWPGLSQSVTMKSGGNTGFGTTSPSGRLSTTGSGTGTNYNLLIANSSNVPLLTVLDNGTFTHQSVTNSTSAFRVFPSGSSAPALMVDTTNRRVGFGVTTVPSFMMDGQFTDTTLYSQTSVTPNGLRVINFDNTANTTAAIYLGMGASGTSYAAINGVRESADNSALTFRTESGGTIAEQMRINSSGNVGIGTTTPAQKLDINGGLKLDTSTAQPTCNATNRGTFWFVRNTAGVKDQVEVCAKDAADAFAWRVIY